MSESENHSDAEGEMTMYEDENKLCSPPSWEKLAAMAGEAESDQEDEEHASHSGLSKEHSNYRNELSDGEHRTNGAYLSRDNSVDNVAVINNGVVNTNDILDMYLKSATRSILDSEQVFHDTEDYSNVALKGCMLRQPAPTRKCVVIKESDNAQKFVIENIGDIEYYEGMPRYTGDMAEAYEDAKGHSGNVQRSRTPSDHDSESVYDTVSSTSSAAPLLRKITHTLPSGSAVDQEVKNDPPKTITTSLESLGKVLLSKTLEQVKKSLEDLSPSHEAEVLHQVMNGTSVRKVSRIYLKNLTVLSICFMILYTAFFSLRNLQSSINHEDGLGLAGLSCLSGSYIVFCIAAPSIVQRIRPKYTLVLAMGGHVLYELAHFYPSFYTMIPASLLLGCSMSCLWVAQGTYLTSIAITYASVTGKKHEGIIGLFNGFFLFWLQLAQIVGNLMSSFVFNMSIWRGFDGASGETAVELEILYGPGTTEYSASPIGNESVVVEHWLQIDQLALNGSTIDASSYCGAEYCHSYTISHSQLFINKLPLYVLLGTYLALTILAICLAGFFLDKLDVIFHKNKSSVRQQMVTLGRLHQDHKIWLLCLMLIFVGMQQAFTFSEVTKAFVTCPLGVHMIGYVMVCFGACDSIMSFLIGQLQRCFSTKLFMTLGAVMHMSLLGIMLLWQPEEDSMYLIFLLAGSLGAVDAIWQTQMCNLIGFLYPKDREAAFASLRMYEGIGFTVAYACAQHICMAMKSYILIGVLIVGMVNYYVMEYLEYKRKGLMSSYPPVDV